MAKITYTPDAGGEAIEFELLETMVTDFEKHKRAWIVVLEELQKEISVRNELLKKE